MWGILLIFALQISQSHAASTHQPSPKDTLSSLQTGPHRTVYPLLEMETKTWVYNMEEFKQEAYNILDDACYYISIS